MREGWNRDSQLSYSPNGMLHCFKRATSTGKLKLHTCYILSSRAMNQLFSGVNFVYRSNSLSIISHFLASFSQNQKLLQWRSRTVLSTLAICHVMFRPFI